MPWLRIWQRIHGIVQCLGQLRYGIRGTDLTQYFGGHAAYDRVFILHGSDQRRD